MNLLRQIPGFSLLAALLSLAATASAALPSTALPTVDHYVYLSFLPNPSDLAQDAKANGLTILRIDELADRVIVSYQYPDGRTATLGYALLGSTPPAPARPVSVEASAPAKSTARYVVSDRDPEVIYVERPSTRVYYYSDPWYGYWAPASVGFALGWSSAYYGGYNRYYGGHYHGGGHHGGGHGGGNHGGGGHGGGGHGGGGGGRGRR